jgi:hypothetical protein
MAKLTKATAVAAFELATATPDSADWRTVAELLRQFVNLPKPAEFKTFWAEYRFGKRAVRTSIAVTFADGRTVRASVNSDPGKPFNIGRGVRVAIAFYRARIAALVGRPFMTHRSFNDAGAELPPWDAHVSVPDIARVERLDTGETVDAYECSTRTAELRRGTWQPFDADPVTLRESYRAAWFAIAGIETPESYARRVAEDKARAKRGRRLYRRCRFHKRTRVAVVPDPVAVVPDPVAVVPDPVAVVPRFRVPLKFLCSTRIAA